MALSTRETKRLEELNAMLAARTSEIGTKKGFGKNVAMIRALIKELEAKEAQS